MCNVTVPIPSITRDFAARDTAVEFCSDGDTETQEERVDDRVPHPDTSRGDVPASQFQRAGENDVTGKDEHDGG